MENSIGISMASYLPYSAFYTIFFLEKAKEADYEFVGMLPFRDARCLISEIFPLKSEIITIKYVEKAWNDGNFLHFLRGLIFRDSQAPKLHDCFFFPSLKKSNQIFNILKKEQGTTEIVHKFKDITDQYTLLEVSPGLWMTPTQIVNEIDKRRLKNPLVLDLYHLRRSPRKDEEEYSKTLVSKEYLGEWQKSINKLLPFTSLIHLSPNRDTNELQDLLNGRGTELERMIKIILEQGYKGPMMVEATLGLKGLNCNKLVETMKLFLCQLKSRF